MEQNPKRKLKDRVQYYRKKILEVGNGNLPLKLIDWKIFKLVNIFFPFLFFSFSWWPPDSLDSFFAQFRRFIARRFMCWPKSRIFVSLCSVSVCVHVRFGGPRDGRFPVCSRIGEGNQNKTSGAYTKTDFMSSCVANGLSLLHYS